MRFRIEELAVANGLTRCITLTLDPKKIPDGADSFRYIEECWRKMRISLRRHLGRNVRFLRIAEMHEGKRISKYKDRRGRSRGGGSGQNTGKAHYHVLVDAGMPQKWLSEAWAAVGGGKVVWIESVDVNDVSAYLAKYMTKKSMMLLPKGVRRVACSRGLVIWPKNEPMGWVVVPVSVETLYQNAGIEAHSEKYSDGPEGETWLVGFKTTREDIFLAAQRVSSQLREWKRGKKHESLRQFLAGSVEVQPEPPPNGNCRRDYGNAVVGGGGPAARLLFPD